MRSVCLSWRAVKSYKQLRVQPVWATGEVNLHKAPDAVATGAGCTRCSTTSGLQPAVLIFCSCSRQPPLLRSHPHTDSLLPWTGSEIAAVRQIAATLKTAYADDATPSSSARYILLWLLRPRHVEHASTGSTKRYHSSGTVSNMQAHHYILTVPYRHYHSHSRRHPPKPPATYLRARARGKLRSNTGQGHSSV